MVQRRCLSAHFSNGSSDGQAAVLETLSAQLTWLDGECIEFAKQAPGILSAQVAQHIRSLCERGRALLRHQAESTALRGWVGVMSSCDWPGGC